MKELFVNSLFRSFRARRNCRCAAWSLLNAFLYINIVLLCLHVLALCLAEKKSVRVCFTFKINGDLLRGFPTVLENLQRLDLSLFPKELERYKACCSG